MNNIVPSGNKFVDHFTHSKLSTALLLQCRKLHVHLHMHNCKGCVISVVYIDNAAIPNWQHVPMACIHSKADVCVFHTM